MARTFATWNPSDKNANVTLSNGNKTATGRTGGTLFEAARSTVGKASGKWYWEITVGSAADNQANGIGSASQTLAAAADMSDLEGVRVYYAPAGTKFAGSTAYGASYTTGAVLGCKLDMDGGTFEFLKNNVSQGTLVSGLTGPIFAYVCLYAGAASAQAVTANFGATAFVYAVPAGYNGGLYEGGAGSGGAAVVAALL